MENYKYGKSILKNLYLDACSNINEPTSEKLIEIIDYINDNYDEDIHVEIEFLKVNPVDDEEYYDDEMIGDDTPLMEKIIYHKENYFEVIDTVSLLSENQHIFINIHDEDIETELIKDSFKDGIIEFMDESENNDDIYYILQKYYNSSSKQIDKIHNTEDFISLFLHDEEFADMVMDIIVDLFDKELEENIKKSENETSVVLVDDLIRETFINIYDSASIYGMNHQTIIELIKSYFVSSVSEDKHPAMYQDFGFEELDKIGSKEFIKCVMISDYIRSLTIKEECNNGLGTTDKSILKFIKDNDIKSILRLFDDTTFSDYIIDSFIEYNSFKDSNIETVNEYTPLVKKLNPLYIFKSNKK